MSQHSTPTTDEVPTREINANDLELWRALISGMNKFDAQINKIEPEQQIAFFALHIEGAIQQFLDKNESLVQRFNPEND